MVVGDDGEVKGVFLSFSKYQALTGKESTNQTVSGPDPEVINREILQAQLTETLVVDNKNLEVISESVSPVDNKVVVPLSPIKNILAKRAKDLFMNQPFGRQEPPLYDLREEVMDPNFGVPLPQPVVETEADEEIKPNFDDI